MLRLLADGRTAGREHVFKYRDEHNCPAHDLLCLGVEIEEDHSVEECSDEEYAEDGANDGSLPAGEGCTTNNSRGNCVELEAVCNGAVARLHLRTEEEAGDSCCRRGQCHDEDLDTPDVDTREVRRFDVCTNRIDGAPEDCFLCDDCHDDEQDDEIYRGYRDIKNGGWTHRNLHLALTPLKKLIQPNE